MNRILIAIALFFQLWPAPSAAVACDQHPHTGAWIQQQIDGFIELAAKRRGEDPKTMNRLFAGGEIKLCGETYVIRKPIDARGMWGLELDGVAYRTQLVPQFGPQDAGKPMLDCTGGSRYAIRDIKFFGGNDRPRSGCAILFARYPNAASAGFHLIENVHVEGMFNVAGVVICASEVNTWIRCNFGMLNDHSPAMIICAQNYGIGLDADVGQSTMLLQDFIQCCWGRSVQPVKDERGKWVTPDYHTFEKPVLWLKSGHVDPRTGEQLNIGSFGDLTFRGGAIDGKGKKSILLSGHHGLIRFIRFYGLRCEADDADIWLTIDVPWPCVVGMLQVRDSQIHMQKRFIDARGAMLGGDVSNNVLIFHSRTDEWAIQARYFVDFNVTDTINYQGRGNARMVKADDYIKQSVLSVGSADDVSSPLLERTEIKVHR